MLKLTSNPQASHIKLGKGKIDPNSIYTRDYPPKNYVKVSSKPNYYPSHLIEGLS